MVLGSQGSSDGSLEGFRKSPGEIWSAPGALWGMFGGPLGIKSWSKTLRILQDAPFSGGAGRRRTLGDE